MDYRKKDLKIGMKEFKNQWILKLKNETENRPQQMNVSSAIRAGVSFSLEDPAINCRVMGRNDDRQSYCLLIIFIPNNISQKFTIYILIY